MEHSADFEFMGYQWSVKPEFASIFREKVIPLVLSDSSSPAVRVIRRKPTRDSFIVSVDFSSPEVFVKVHKYDKPRERIKATLGFSRARAEWKMGERMFDCGLPVAEPLGLGERRSRGVVSGSMLISRAIPQTISLSRYLREEFSSEPSSQSEKRNEFLRSLGQLVRRIHAAGFGHPDLHTANILVSTNISPPAFWLVDLHSAGSSSSISHRRRMTDLAMLQFSLRGLLDESQMRVVLAGYKPEAGEAEIATMSAELSRSADAIHKRRVRSRAKRCLKTSGSFMVETQGNVKLYRRREFDSGTIIDAMNRHNAIKMQTASELVKAKSSSALSAFPVSDAVDERLYVKEFTNRGFIRLLETLFYVHRGRRAWKAGNLLRVLRVPCAEPVALIEARRCGLPHTSYLVMKEIPNAVRLDTFLVSRYSRDSGLRARKEILEKRDLIREGACALRAFHARKIYHKDLSAKNLLVNPDSNGERRFYCVDLDSLQFPPRLSLRRRLKNLAQLNGVPSCVTTTDKMRFYKEYFGVGTLSMKHKLFLRIISRLSRRRFLLSRQSGQKRHAQGSSGAETYEDITSL